MSSVNRRDLFKNILSLTGLVAVGSLISNKSSSQERRRGGGTAAAAGPVLADPNDPAMKSMNYVHKISDIKDKSLIKEKQGVKPEGQTCDTCSFYDKSKETTVNGMKAGGCMLPQFKGKLVAAKGHCTSWNKK